MLINVIYLIRIGYNSSFQKKAHLKLLSHVILEISIISMNQKVVLNRFGRLSINATCVGQDIDYLSFLDAFYYKSCFSFYDSDKKIS